MSRDNAASIRARLLNQAKHTGEEFELFLVRYACERFLYRLGASEFRDRCILKGAALLSLWMGDPYRATRDLDFLAYGPNDEASIRKLVKSICDMPCTQDGMTFDFESLDISPIRAEEEYTGQRAVFRAFLGTARIRMQIDFGFGDAVVPGPEEAVYPTMIDGLPAPRLRTYRREVSVAEKFEAMVHLGRRNSRMKDFHDIWALSSAFAFEGVVLQRAIVACFERRGTAWSVEPPDALSAAFYSDMELANRWKGYLRAGAFQTSPPPNFNSIGDRVRSLLGPLRDSVIAGDALGKNWQPGGPWR